MNNETDQKVLQKLDLQWPQISFLYPDIAEWPHVEFSWDLTAL